MINYLHINNFAIIDEVELELDGGLTVLTGETGAGKSIVVDALGLVLGGRADSGVVRAGAERAEIVMTADVRDLPAARTWLEERSLGEGDEIIVRRVIGAEGRSRAYINDRAVSLSSLKELGQQLVDIHGQQDHHSLTQPAVQRELLDFHGGLAAQAAATAAAYRDWQRARQTLEDLHARQHDRQAQQDLLSHQVGELQALALAAGEYEELSQEHERLKHGGRLLEGAQQALNLLYEGEVTAQSLLARSGKSLEQLLPLDPALAPICELLEQAQVQLVEGSHQLGGYLESLDLDPGQADKIAQRIHDARELARKHRVEPAELHELLPRLAERLAELEQSEVRLESLAAEERKAGQQYLRLAEALHAGRLKAAESFGAQVTQTMRTLGMADGRFVVDVRRLAEDQARAHGVDEIAFLVSANPGQPPGALSRIASGGELSRISLAIQVVAADGNPVPCMVFDEVDAGVGGRVAEIVGRKLRELGKARQVLCVTHLPQVASLGHQHLRVHKESANGSTRTRIVRLDGPQKIEELARMLGGIDITERTRAHAEEMLAGAAD